jgi:serine/threonine protein kinase
LIDRDPKGQMSISDALRVAIHVGGALEHVRDKGFMHLDLSLSNSIVACGRPMLIDFGNARRQGEARPSEVTGTDSYIAPEECRLEESPRRRCVQPRRGAL